MSEKQNRMIDRPMFILKYLMERTDDEHRISLTELMDYCERNGHGASRNTICNDIELLHRYGCDIISEKEGCRNTYSYGARPIETAEIRLLMDLISATPCISAEKAQSLNTRLAQLAGFHEAEKLRESISVEQEVHGDNHQLFWNIDVINRAINMKKLMSFHYGVLNEKREYCLVKGGKKILLAPYMTTMVDGFYYVVGLVATKDNKFVTSSFRVDCMKNACIEKLESWKKPSSFSPADWRKKIINRESQNKEVEVVLYCDNSAMTLLVDKFGKEFFFEEVDEQHFRATVCVAPGSSFFAWLFSNAKTIKVLGPNAVVKKYQERLKLALES